MDKVALSLQKHSNVKDFLSVVLVVVFFTQISSLVHVEIIYNGSVMVTSYLAKKGIKSNHLLKLLIKRLIEQQNEKVFVQLTVQSPQIFDLQRYQ